MTSVVPSSPAPNHIGCLTTTLAVEDPNSNTNNTLLPSASVLLPKVIHVIAPSNLGGLGVFASHDVPERATIFIDRPSSPLLHRCQSCGGGPKSAQISLTRCSGCRCVWHCSEECRSRDLTLHHGKECGLLKLVSERAHPALRHHVIEAEKSLLCAWVTVVQEAARGVQKGRRLIDMRYCFSNNEQDFPAKELYGLLPDIAKQLYTPIEFIALVRMFNTNIFENGIFYPTISRINHSCSPNAIQVNGIVQSLVTIKKGEEIVINYLQGLSKPFSAAPAAVRRIFLLNQWRFACNCPACHDPASDTIVLNSTNVSNANSEMPSTRSSRSASVSSSPHHEEVTKKPEEEENKRGESPPKTFVVGGLEALLQHRSRLDVASQWLEGLSHGFLCPSTKCRDHPLIAACREFMYGEASSQNNADGGDTKTTAETKINHLSPQRALDPQVYKNFTSVIRRLLEANHANNGIINGYVSSSSATLSALNDTASTMDAHENTTFVGPPPLFIPTQVPFGPSDVMCCRCGGSMKDLFGGASTLSSSSASVTPAPVLRAIWSHVSKYLENRQKVLADYEKSLADAKAKSAVVETDATTIETALSRKEGASDATANNKPQNDKAEDEKTKKPKFIHNPIFSHRLTASWSMDIAMKMLPQLKSGSPDFIEASRFFALPLGPSATLLDPTQFNMGDFVVLEGQQSRDASAVPSDPAAAAATKNTNPKKKKSNTNSNKHHELKAGTSSSSQERSKAKISVESTFNSILKNVYKLPLSLSGLLVGADNNNTNPAASSLIVPLLPPLLGILPTNVHWLRLTIALDELFDKENCFSGALSGDGKAQTKSKDGGKSRFDDGKSNSDYLGILALCRFVAALRTDDPGLIPSICRNILSAKFGTPSCTTPEEESTALTFDFHVAQIFLKVIDESFGTALSEVGANERVIDSIVQVADLYDHTTTFFSATMQTSALMPRTKRHTLIAGGGKLFAEEAKKEGPSREEGQKGKNNAGGSKSTKNQKHQPRKGDAFFVPSCTSFGETASKELMSIMVSTGKVF